MHLFPSLVSVTRNILFISPKRVHQDKKICYGIISFFFPVGPSTAYNTACSTSLVALDAAERHLRMGIIDNAIVGGSNFIYRPATTKLFMGMNFLGSSSCKAFDESGNV